MKKILFVVCMLGFGLVGFSQKYAIIDTRYILDKMPDYKEAQKQLDDIEYYDSMISITILLVSVLNIFIINCFRYSLE